MGKYTYTSNLGKKEYVAFPAGHGSESLLVPTVVEVSAEDWKEGSICAYELLWQQAPQWLEIKKMGITKIYVGNLLAVHLLRRRHSLGQMLSRHSELWNKQTLTGRLLLPIHIHRSFIIQALSVLSVMPRFDAQKFREEHFALGWDLRVHLVQFRHCIDKETLHHIYYKITFSFDNLILVFISLSLSARSNFYSQSSI